MMLNFKYPLLIPVFIILSYIASTASAIAKSDCELKQILSDKEFEGVKSKWQTKPSPDEKALIYFYDTTANDFKDMAILRWRKKGGETVFTIKTRTDSKLVDGMDCQNDYTGPKLCQMKKSCQIDSKSPSYDPENITLSSTQKDFLKLNKLKWEHDKIFSMGPITSIKETIDSSACQELKSKKPMEIETWEMNNKSLPKSLPKKIYEISVKVDGKDKKCELANATFRKCLQGIGIAVNDDRGTKTEEVYEFYSHR